jgi:oligoribonuclease NrnB/cAMP/cGMP phosphodiesterase (DHH superfamily)
MIHLQNPLDLSMGRLRIARCSVHDILKEIGTAAMRKTYVIYHARCLDGMTSAAIAFEKFGDQATYLPAFYDKLPFDELVDSDIYLLDFSLQEQPLLDLISKGNKITIIDHHEDPVKAIAHVPIHELIYDVEESGASLAWGYFFPELPPPKMVQYAKDYDLWTFKLPETRGFIAWLEQFPLDIMDFNQKLKMNDDDYAKAIEIGAPLYRYKMNLVDAIIEMARPCVIKGRTGWMVNGPYPLSSVIGEQLAIKKDSYAMIWSERSDKMIQMSFRSTSGMIPQVLAQELGGNGHKKAAGCVLSQKAFQRLVAASDRALEQPEP